MRSATAAAVALVEKEKKTAYEASKITGVAQSTIHRAIERGKQCCPHCGRPMKAKPAPRVLSVAEAKARIAALTEK